MLLVFIWCQILKFNYQRFSGLFYETHQLRSQSLFDLKETTQHRTLSIWKCSKILWELLKQSFLWITEFQFLFSKEFRFGFINIGFTNIESHVLIDFWWDWKEILNFRRILKSKESMLVLKFSFHFTAFILGAQIPCA